MYSDPNFYPDHLSEPNSPVVNIVQDIISRKNAKTPAVVNEYNQLHQKPNLELKTLYVVLKHGADCKKIIQKKRPKRLSKRRRQALKKKQQR